MATLTLRDMKRTQRSVIASLLRRGHFPGEGSSSAAELLYLARTAQLTNARLAGEIGFNAGFSSHALLEAHPDVRVISFDLCQHRSATTAKEIIDRRFPGRHTLICGDSRSSVPALKASSPALQFDLVFIDGGHTYEVAKADLLNMKELSSEKTAVIMDDLVPWLGYGKGPTRAWKDAIHEGVLHQHELFKNGKRVDVLKPPGRRGWALGQYVFSPTG
jgi:predicted O-methyltransferase YrrM